MVARGGVWVWVKWVERVNNKKFQLEISHGDIMYTMVSIVNNSVAYLGVTKRKFSLQEKCNCVVMDVN